MEKTDKLIKIVIGLTIGYVASEIAADALESFGVPKHTATVAGGIVGAIV